MNSQKMMLKWAAVASSLLLGATFVGYRAGALDWRKASLGREHDVRATAEPGSTDVYLVPDDLLSPADAEYEGSEMFYSSKAGGIFTEASSSPGPVKPQTEAAAGSERVILSGTKSLMVIPPSRPADLRQSELNPSDD